MIFKRESELERYATKLAESCGWFQDKIMRTSRGGFPDRFFAKAGEVVLVEFKRADGGSLQPNQVKRHKELRAAGVRVELIDSKEDAHRVFV